MKITLIIDLHIVADLKPVVTWPGSILFDEVKRN